MDQLYLIAGQRWRPTDAGFDGALAVAHGLKERPLCLCKPSGVATYVAQVGSRFVLKRMPDSGHLHAAGCVSFEPPAELSGVGKVAGTAILEDAVAGTTTLKLAFPLRKGFCARPIALPSDAHQEPSRNVGERLSLRGLLHYLWDQAGLSNWAPNTGSKRSWFAVRRGLLDAADAKSAKGCPLAKRLFVPETFQSEHKAAIEERTVAHLKRLHESQGRARELMVLIGEVKKIAPARFGFKVVVKHLPDLPFLVDENLARLAERRFRDELALWAAHEETHLVVIATFGAADAGMLAIEDLAFMATSENWMPTENAHDLMLFAALTRTGRQFMRGLRYNLSQEIPVATAVVTDVAPIPVAMYVVPIGATIQFRTALLALISQSGYPAWVWNPREHRMPALPGRECYEAPLEGIARAVGLEGPACDVDRAPVGSSEGGRQREIPRTR